MYNVRKHTITAGLFGLLLAFAGAAAALDMNGGMAVQSLLQHRMMENHLDGVRVAVHDDVATLTGSVDTLHDRDLANKLAERLDEIHSVVDQTTLASVGRDIADIEGDLQHSLDLSTVNGVFDWVEADLKGTEVTLKGSVRWPVTATLAYRRVASIPGVTAVHNDLVVQPVSGRDDEIRHLAYSLLYGDLSFHEYAFWPLPPIHILVDSGHITLKGTVRSRGERMLAQSLLSSTVEAYPVDNQLRVAKELPR